MKFIRLAAVVVLMICSSAGYAGEFAGMWVGALTVVVDSRDVKLPFVMEIFKGKDGGYTGRCVLVTKIDNKEYHIGTEVTCSVSGNDMTFKDGVVLEETLPPAEFGFHWCTKIGLLSFSGDDLKGSVAGSSPDGDCMPATVLLKRKETK